MKIIHRRAKQVLVAISGGFVVLIGIIAIPYPGPGWLIVFAGLGILATEFAWARYVLDKLRANYDAWLLWAKRQHWSLQLALFILTCMVVIVTVWLLNGYELINNWLHLGQPWLRSPLPLFS